MRKKRTDKEIHIHTRFCGEEEFTGKKSKSKTKQNKKIIMRIKYEMQEYWRRKKKTSNSNHSEKNMMENNENMHNKVPNISI